MQAKSLVVTRPISEDFLDFFFATGETIAIAFLVFAAVLNFIAARFNGAFVKELEAEMEIR